MFADCLHNTWIDFIYIWESTSYFDYIYSHLEPSITFISQFTQAVISKDECSNGSFQVLLLFQVPICCSGGLFCNQKQRDPAVSRTHYYCPTGT